MDECKLTIEIPQLTPNEHVCLRSFLSFTEDNESNKTNPFSRYSCTHPSLHPHIYSFGHTSNYPPISPSIHLSAKAPTLLQPSIRPCIHPSTHLSINPSIFHPILHLHFLSPIIHEFSHLLIRLCKQFIHPSNIHSPIRPLIHSSDTCMHQPVYPYLPPPLIRIIHSRIHSAVSGIHPSTKHSSINHSSTQPSVYPPIHPLMFISFNDPSHKTAM